MCQFAWIDVTLGGKVHKNRFDDFKHHFEKCFPNFIDLCIMVIGGATKASCGGDIQLEPIGA